MKTKSFVTAVALAVVVALSTTGCFSRNVIEAEDQTGTGATYLRSVDAMDFVVLAKFTDQFWECKDSETKLTCTKMCDGDTDLTCVSLWLPFTLGGAGALAGGASGRPTANNIGGGK